MYAHNFVIFRVVVLCQVAYKKAPFEIGWTIFFVVVNYNKKEENKDLEIYYFS